jgi:hypothetical protein
MSSLRNETVTVRKTKKLNRQKLVRMARRFGLAPIVYRELQLGYDQVVPKACGEALVAAKYVTIVKSGAEKLVEVPIIDLEPEVDTTEDQTPVVTLNDDESDNTEYDEDNSDDDKDESGSE